MRFSRDLGMEQAALAPDEAQVVFVFHTDRTGKGGNVAGHRPSALATAASSRFIVRCSAGSKSMPGVLVRIARARTSRASLADSSSSCAAATRLAVALE